jgi:hypothetical protein
VSGGFSHPGKVQFARFLMVTFSGSHQQIFLHCLFAHLLKIHPPESIEMP